MKKPGELTQGQGDLLTRVVEAVEKRDFFRSILLNDNFDDWDLAKDFGNFLIRLEPEELMGHALLARAYRHLGDTDNALSELKECRQKVAHPSEEQLFASFLTEEEMLLTKGPR
jgi:hypothetical protein